MPIQIDGARSSDLGPILSLGTEPCTVAEMADGNELALALHWLRLKGSASADSLGPLLGAPTEDVLEQLLLLEADGLARLRTQPDGKQLWALTNAGLRRHEQRLAGDLALAGSERVAVETRYQAFVPLNRRFLVLCTRWQVRTGPDGGDVVNRHDDPAYDAVVLTALGRLHDEAIPMLDGLVGALPRLQVHRQRLIAARERIESGDHSWIAEPLIDSYHTVWFELHEDLLLTLGLDRAIETAAEAASSGGPAQPNS